MNSWQPPYESFTAEGMAANLTFWIIWVMLAFTFSLIIKGERGGMSWFAVFMMCFGIEAIALGIVWAEYFLWHIYHSHELMMISLIFITGVMSLNAVLKI